MDEHARMKLAELTGQINAINTEMATLLGVEGGNYLVLKALSRLTEVEYLIGQALMMMANRPAA